MLLLTVTADVDNLEATACKQGELAVNGARAWHVCKMEGANGRIERSKR